MDLLKLLPWLTSHSGHMLLSSTFFASTIIIVLIEISAPCGFFKHQEILQPCRTLVVQVLIFQKRHIWVIWVKYM